MVKIVGSMVDNEGRCIHYDSQVDVVANKCSFCKKYYACFRCHDEHENHSFLSWPISKNPDEKIVVCGSCHYEMTYSEYSTNRCLNCGHLFNKNCSIHQRIYFEIND
ncbi:CHY zinc finger protein [Candidatus Enterococcus mansonii]|uniref:CHY zinc finger protein n=1 Tax=Candidatus Enterococcus mansonii TaxID=1834181 RepID=UPI000A33F4F3|nr:CHY zinc finger protein [Enterococcus sp. 4G2_DIV0659]